MDVTELKNREADLQMQEKENTRLLANEAAAKEASRLKSQFLANVRSNPDIIVSHSDCRRCPMKSVHP